MDKNTKFMTRIFSAVINNEEEILNQIENDMDIALEDGKLEAEQYSMKKLSDTEVEVTDKVNNEKTKLSINDNGVIESESMESDQSPVEGEVKELDSVKEFAKNQHNFIARIGGKDVVFDYDKKVVYFIDNPKITVPFDDSSLVHEIIDQLEVKSKTFSENDTKAELDRLKEKTKLKSDLDNISDKYVKSFTARHREVAKLNIQNRNLDKLSPNVRAYVEKRLAELDKK